MFTAKFIDGLRTRILEAESFTILRQSQGGTQPGSCHEWAEITLHHRNGDLRVDVGHYSTPEIPGAPDVYNRCYIENAAGKTIERVDFGPVRT